ncbi:DUF1716 domain protein [Saitoella complicata NRRL Y-17804]|uniref:Beta-catenin-like protein 1 N-terminal domain-containing protein n=1 Tax=Saitoella complicata (strain BCRC 22490 / CBS 7301 / JCM 7358 / NBRC 10748 / NRRL Y-17804) TaxID=698492 RepID=A0A0E9NA74_SAICN|nr:DUF1716 domain protein [Saitoella complicata NRRL Y-17804]ODQ55877.1 DUF1716 domain protein [Saitoella complicata NRRL Y-17804]GAO46787.1 hypothetical protein G7K_1006-t1 [Saitoella complicata NRRL Y-17804]
MDDFFKKPTFPASSLKRKQPPAADDPTEAYKALKLDRPAEDADASAAFVDEPFIDEEGGRFEGSGLTEEQSQILDFMDQNDAEQDQTIDRMTIPQLKKLALKFERAISKNHEMRAKFLDHPQKFMESEADLDAEIKGLTILGETPELFSEFVKLGCIRSLVNLLAHENTDIAIDVVEVLRELTDEDTDAADEDMKALIDALMEAEIMDMLTQNLSRLDESQDVDRSGVYHTLSIFENLAAHDPALAETAVRTTTILQWILKRLQVKEASTSQNKQYAAELLAILVQSSYLNRVKLAELDGVDVLLRLLSPYRKRDPAKGGEEEEMMENGFDALCSVVEEVPGKDKFVEAEGVELCLIMIKEGKMSKARAVKVVDHATSGRQSVVVATKIVDAGGLKAVFSMFMKRPDGETMEHILGIFASLLRLLPLDSPPRIRTMAKFTEKDYEKLVRLVELRREYAARVGQAERRIAKQKAQATEEDLKEREPEWYLQKIDAGLYCLQILDTVLAWICAEDDGAKAKLNALLTEEGKDIGHVRAVLQEFMENIDDTTADEAGDEADGAAAKARETMEDATEQKDMLQTLIHLL